MKGKVKKLRKEPVVSREYHSVIKQQLASGVIERVAELERSDGVYYIPYLAVIRKEGSTTKLRVVYDTLTKSGKEGTSFIRLFTQRTVSYPIFVLYFVALCSTHEGAKRMSE